MAGDLHIRVCETRKQKSARRADARAASFTDHADGRRTIDRTQVRIGGRWYDFDFYLERFGDVEWDAVRSKEYPDRFSEHLYQGPDVWVGRLSRMGVVLDTMSDEEAIPQVCQRVMKLFGNRVLVVINKALIAGVAAAFDGAKLHPVYKQAPADDVLAFLQQHKGKRAWLY